MDAQKIIKKLSNKYPEKAIVKNIEDSPSEILCEIEPSSKHPEYSLAVSVIDKSIPHIHNKSREVYKVVRGTITLFVDDKVHRLNEGQELTINPGQAHWAEGNETWIECYSKPGWQLTDHLELKEGNNLYNPNNIPAQTWISPRVCIKTSSVEGKGMVALTNIRKGEAVVVWGGDYTDKKGAEKAQREGKLVMQWDKNLYSVEERGDDPSYYINHSCNPNLWMTNAVTLVARRDIEKGEELTADYSMWEADEDYVSKWKCLCGSRDCRGRVTGKDWRIKELQDRYKNHFSPLINQRIQKSK